MKEKSSSAKTEYLATCKVLGEPATEIKYFIRDLAQLDPLKPLEGKLFFDHSIEMDWLIENEKLFDMFDIFYYDQDYVQGTRGAPRTQINSSQLKIIENTPSTLSF